MGLSVSTIVECIKSGRLSGKWKSFRKHGAKIPIIMLPNRIAVSGRIFHLLSIAGKVFHNVDFSRFQVSGSATF